MVTVYLEIASIAFVAEAGAGVTAGGAATLGADGLGLPAQATNPQADAAASRIAMRARISTLSSSQIAVRRLDRREVIPIRFCVAM
jgi:hypothetical protein